MDENGLADPDVREAAVYERLTALGISWKTVAHRPVFTVAESADVNEVLAGAHTKNLFLKDAKGGLWLVCLRCDLKVDLKALAKQLHAPRFSFGSPELLIATLGIAPGAVNPFSLMNDKAGKVTVILDAGMMAMDPLNFHPMRNDRTTAISAENLRKFLVITGHKPVITSLPCVLSAEK
jgi:Ala-tRNA(Pro) deacylase